MYLTKSARTVAFVGDLLPALTITTAVAATSTTPITNLGACKTLTIEAIFTYGSGGTTADAYVQTSLDQGVTWIDIANFHFTTSSGKKVFNLSARTPATTAVVPTDGSMSVNTSQDGILGDQFRVKYVTTGTYAASTTLQVAAVVRS